MLTFDAEKHQYVLDGEPLPSVTQLIPKPKFWCSPEQLECARIEGEENHSLIKMFLDTGDAYNDPYLLDFSAFLDANRALLGEPVMWETPLCSRKHLFAGTPDIIFKKSIVDIKRSLGDTRLHALQLAGYAMLARENKILSTKRWYVVYHTAGGFKIKLVYNIHAETIFLSLVKKYHIERSVDSYLSM